VVSGGEPSVNSPTTAGRFTSTRRAVRSQSSSLLTAIKVSAAVLLLGPVAARGQTTVRAVTSVSGGASDNARGIANPDQRRTSSVIGRSSAGLDLGYQAATSNHLLRLAVGATGYPGSDAGTSFSQELYLVSQFSWERSVLEFGVTGSHSQLDDLQPLLDTNLAGAAQPEPLVPSFSEQVRPDEELVPVGTVAYLSGSLAQGLSIELSPVWSFYQSAGFDVFSSVVDRHVTDAIWAVSGDLGIERAWARNSGRLEATIGHEYAPMTLTEEGVIPEEEGEFGRAALGWTHQFAPTWRGDVSGGAFAARATSDQELFIGPSWRGALNWKGRAFRALLSYDHSAQPSVVMGGIFLTDRATVRGSGRFGRDERFRFTSTLRYTRLGGVGPTAPGAIPPPPVDLMNPTPPEPPKPIPEDQRHDHANRWQAVVALGWTPWANRLFELDLSYRLTTQTGAAIGRRRMKTFERNVVMLTVTLGLPMRPETGPDL
jgi:hypothetical protein